MLPREVRQLKVCRSEANDQSWFNDTAADLFGGCSVVVFFGGFMMMGFVKKKRLWGVRTVERVRVYTPIFKSPICVSSYGIFPTSPSTLLL